MIVYNGINFLKGTGKLKGYWVKQIKKGKVNMLEIAVCEDLEIHRQLIKEKISSSIDEAYKIVEFVSAEDFKKA